MLAAHADSVAGAAARGRGVLRGQRQGRLRLWPFLGPAFIACVGFIGVCYLGELFKAKPPLGTVAHHAVVPQFAGGESVLLAVGILGATVMPHVIYLHSALLQNRIRPETDEQARTLMRFTRVDVVLAMTIAGLINMP